MASNALVGGLGGYYLQTLYITFEQAEEFERKWRELYRSKFGDTFEECGSKPRVMFYKTMGKKPVRRLHLWAVGLTAIVTYMNQAVADPSDTNQRAACRSTIACAMERWGRAGRTRASGNGGS